MGPLGRDNGRTISACRRQQIHYGTSSYWTLCSQRWLLRSPLMGAFRYIFARLYGYTLGRSSRNRPTEACQDAITQFMIVVGVPAICVLFVLMVSVYPQLLASKNWIPWLTIPAAVVFYGATRFLRRYAQVPEIADQFRSPRSRRITMTLYIMTLLLSVVIAGIAARLLRPQ